MTISETNLSALAAFAEVAGRYVTFIDGLHAGRPQRLYCQLEELLPRLHQAILAVESETTRDEHAEFGDLCMTHEAAAEVSRLIEKTVDEQTLALFEWHQEIAGDETAAAAPDATRADMLFDDLADIYRDVHDGLALWNVGTPDAQAEAASQWRLNYELHWGEHLFRAMLTVHEVRYHLFEE